MANATLRTAIRPEEVHRILARHILVDGFDLVLDLEGSHTPYLRDKRSGRDYLDFFTFFASSPLGLNHPKVVGDIEFLERLLRAALANPSNSDIYTEEYALFVDTFSRIAIPDFLPYAFFISGGTLAVENALKVAFDWKVRKNFAKGYRYEKGHQVLHFEQAFHGRSGYCLSLTNTDWRKTALFPKFDWPRVINPKITFPLTPERLEELEKRERLAIRQAKQHFYERKDDIAAIIIEPIQGEGGDNHFRREFFEQLRQLADENDALLIFDEVQTGVGLTGKFWAYEHFVKPDILVFGKKMQVCGILVSRRIDEIEEHVFRVSSRINSTWGGNLADMVRATKFLEIIEEDKLVENAAAVGAYLLERLHELQMEFPHLVSNARGRGLMCAIDLPNAELRQRFLEELKAEGLLMLPCGERSVRFRPPLCIGREQVDMGIGIIRAAMSRL
ncbi:MAG: L-lysine 6-transaminase [Bacteroidetes bacterium]|nr:L-lysine 6-transaminase [Rhodothermia bacterium]MCS7155133.1 L-lysine 6-transaminase [Bacteroidota bacterium]MCX7907358.1 L-lysine 6-transaminase [Bacteroidota bacterium]MDW8137915.1 L-lysine 6-transaminase [Bacteroidota bacterium]MDW8286234.1 L-lysine 6-transaminase [Bacteroidota bacterium]